MEREYVIKIGGMFVQTVLTLTASCILSAKQHEAYRFTDETVVAAAKFATLYSLPVVIHRLTVGTLEIVSATDLLAPMSAEVEGKT